MTQVRSIDAPPSPAETPAAAGGARQGEGRAATTQAAEAAAAKRVTSKGIGAGDIVLVDKRGRRFHALVTVLERLESGRFELAVRPLDGRISYRTASVREVVEVWRRARL